MKQAECDAGYGDGGLFAGEREKLARRERQNKRPKMEREIQKRRLVLRVLSITVEDYVQWFIVALYGVPCCVAVVSE